MTMVTKEPEESLYGEGQEELSVLGHKFAQ